MKAPSMNWLKGAATLLLAIGLNLSLPSASARAEATGSWKWTTTGRDGQTVENVLKLKQDGDKLTGVLVGRNGTETAIGSAKIQDGTISFTVTRERNGQSFTAKYQGKISGNSIKGTIETERNGETRSRDWEAESEKPAAKAAGTWKWSFTTQDGTTRESTLKLQQTGEKLAGTVTGRAGETAIQEAKLNGDEISFTVTRERDGQKFTSKYNGTISGDTIKGKSEMAFGDQTRTRDWEAKRELAANVAGTWQWTMTTPNGDTIQRKIKLKLDGDKLTGVSYWNDNETAIEQGKVAGNEVSFQVVREINGNTITAKYHGKLDGDSLKGKIEGHFGGEDRSFDWDAKRAKE
jgi:hypothetical protein